LNAIAIRGLVQRYGAHAIFDGLDLNVAHASGLLCSGPAGVGSPRRFLT